MQELEKNGRLDTCPLAIHRIFCHIIPQLSVGQCLDISAIHKSAPLGFVVAKPFHCWAVSSIDMARPSLPRQPSDSVSSSLPLPNTARLLTIHFSLLQRKSRTPIGSAPPVLSPFALVHRPSVRIVEKLLPPPQTPPRPEFAPSSSNNIHHRSYPSKDSSHSPMSRKKPPLPQRKCDSSQQHSQEIKDRLQKTQNPRSIDHSTNLIIMQSRIRTISIVTRPFPSTLLVSA